MRDFNRPRPCAISTARAHARFQPPAPMRDFNRPLLQTIGVFSMKAFMHMVGASLVMLMRNRALLLSSAGLALISIFIFGWLFSGNGSLKVQLGIVNSDTSTVASQVISQLQQNDALQVFIGTQDAELAALKNGQRDAVLVLGSDFGATLRMGSAQIQVYYNQSNPTTLAITRQAVQSIVDGIDQQATGKMPPVTLTEQAVSVHNLRQIDFITPGQLGMMLMWANLIVGTVLVGWRQTGVMKRLAATPLRPATLIAAQMVARLVLSLAQAALLLGVAMLVFGVQVIGNWGVLALTVVVGTASMMAIGFVIGSFAKNQDVAQAISLTISFPMMFLGGSYFSTDGAPAALQPVINALPLSHLNDALRQIINNGASLAAVQNDLLILLAWLVAGLILATRAFRWN
jgi:ABC-2 type transport system permease protein